MIHNVELSSSLVSLESSGARHEKITIPLDPREAHLSTLALTRSILGTGTVPSARLDFHSPCSAFKLPAFWWSCEPVTMPHALRTVVARLQCSIPTCVCLELGEYVGPPDSPLHFTLDPLGGRFSFRFQPRRLCFCLSFFLQLVSLGCPAFGRTRDGTNRLRARVHHTQGQIVGSRWGGRSDVDNEPGIELLGLV